MKKYISTVDLRAEMNELNLRRWNLLTAYQLGIISNDQRTKLAIENRERTTKLFEAIQTRRKLKSL